MLGKKRKDSERKTVNPEEVDLWIVRGESVFCLSP
jgi:hypothetical protein